MYLSLKNFRCWEEKELSIPENKNLNLIHGDSGKGKSSILLGILFAIYGKGRNLTTYGKKKCQVKLKLNLPEGDFIITRSKNPCKLIVEQDGKKYENKVAQEIIYKTLGKNFETIGYVGQDTFSSFIYLSPADKLTFLEDLLFSKVNLKDIKDKCKSKIRDTENEFRQVKGKRQGVETFEIEIPEEVSFPINCSEKTRDIAVNNVNKRKKKIEKKIKDLEKEINELKVKFAVKEEKEKRLREIEGDKIFTIELRDISKMKEKLKEEKSDLKDFHTLRLFLSYSEEKRSYDEMKEREDNEITLQMKEITDKLWSKIKKDDCLKAKKESENYNLKLERKKKVLSILAENPPPVKTKEELLLETKELKNIIRDCELSKNIYTCPSCKENLQLTEGKLKVFSLKVNFNDKIEELAKKLKKAENELDSLKVREKLEIELDELNNEKKGNWSEKVSYLELNLNLEKELVRLKGLSNSSTLISLKEKLKERENEISNLEKPKREGLNEEVIRKNIYSLEKEIYLEEEKTKKLEKLKIEKEKLKTELSDFSSVSTLPLLEEGLKLEKEKREEILCLEDKIKAYLISSEEKKKYDEWKEKIEDLKKEEKKMLDTLTCLETLKESILEAESISIQNTIDNININANRYLISFFPDEQISANLIPFKESKKDKTSKPQINLVIDYKGMDCDMTYLSGGERQRVSLAFVLGMSDIFTSSLLLLDEATSHLDYSSTDNIISGIKDNLNGDKTVLMVIHHPIKTHFDTVIEV